MVRGLLAPFKEVIYYNFDTVLEWDRGKGKANIDLELLGEIIERVERAGGLVRSVTMDMGNRTLLSECKVNISVHGPYQSFALLRFHSRSLKEPTTSCIL